MPSQPLHLDLIPMDLAWADPKENVRRMESAIAERLNVDFNVPSESRIFVFPEVSLTAFVTDGSEDAALDRNAPEVQQVRELARKYRTAVVFGFPEKWSDSKQPLNTLLFVSPEGEDLADYQKLHLFTAGASPESDHYQRGDSGTLLVYRGWKIGFGICFDLRFPTMFQSYAREGVDLIILPACWIGGPGKSYQFRTLSTARAIENQCFFAALNRSGKDNQYSYEGEVLCFGPKGDPLEGSAGFSLDPTLLEEARKLKIRPSDLEEYPVLVRE